MNLYESIIYLQYAITHTLKHSKIYSHIRLNIQRFKGSSCQEKLHFIVPIEVLGAFMGKITAWKEERCLQAFCL